jgi:peptidoglycan/LPS O-acetylase OafA/YrhL
MKKSYLLLIISALVLLTTFLWLVNTKKPINAFEIGQFGIIFVLIGFGVLVGISRLKSEKRGEPVEDELSKKILLKASSISYYISLYMWIGLMYFCDKIKLENHTLIGAGILGMAITFLICWIIYKIKGMKDA